jgi:hypothetical protein
MGKGDEATWVFGIDKLPVVASALGYRHSRKAAVRFMEYN